MLFHLLPTSLVTVIIHHICTKEGTKNALAKNNLYIHISSSTQHHSYLPESWPFELSNSTERRQVSPATSSEIRDCNQGFTKQASYQFFPNLETKSTLKFLNVNAFYSIWASETEKETLDRKGITSLEIRPEHCHSWCKDTQNWCKETATHSYAPSA